MAKNTAALSPEFWIVFGGRSLQILIALFSLRAITTILSPEQLGYYYVITAIVSWFGLVLMNPIGMYANRKANSWASNKQLPQASVVLFIYSLVLSALSVPTVWILNLFFNFSEGGFALALVGTVAAQIAITGFGQTQLSLINLTGSRKVYVSLAVITQFLILVSAIGLAKFLDGSAYAWLAGVAIGNAVISAIAFILFLKRNGEAKSSRWLDLDIIEWKQLVGFALPVLFATLLMWGQTQGYRLFIEGWLGRESLAKLAIALGTAVSIFAVIESFVHQYFMPKLYRVMDENAEIKSAAWNQLNSTVITSYLTIFFACAFIAPRILSLLVAPTYHNLGMIFAIGLAIELFRVVTTLAYLATHSEWRTNGSLLPYALGLCTIAIGGFTQYSLADSSLNTFAAILAAGGLVTCFSMWKEVRKMVPLQFPWKQSLWAFSLTLPIALLNFLPIDSIAWLLLTTGSAAIWTLLILYRIQTGSFTLNLRQK